MSSLLNKVGVLTFLFSCLFSEASEIPFIKIADSINPGTADYIISSITQAEQDKSPYLVIQMDTPGGLLTSTRSIIQKMLNSSVVVVVHIGPQGAHAGSAGALITLASDIASMAPGTNIGAAHPVVPGAEKMDKVMDEKMTNDVAAFAESLATAKGRNREWAIKAVKKSASITSDQALKEGVIDLIASDLPQLFEKLRGFSLKVAKNAVKSLPSHTIVVKEIPMSIKHRLVSFFADPNLAYLVMSLGGLCIWVELTHPGLIFPGVLGAICVLLSLIAFQLMPIHYGALFLVLLGMGLIIAEVYVTSYGVLGTGGIISFLLGSLFLMDSDVPEFQISYSVIIPTALVLVGSALLLGYVVMRSRKARHLSGTGSLVGEVALVQEAVSVTPGKVLVQGELWNAISDSSLPEGCIVVVTEVRNMLLVVKLR